MRIPGSGDWSDGWDAAKAGWDPSKRVDENRDESKSEHWLAGYDAFVESRIERGGDPTGIIGLDKDGNVVVNTTEELGERRENGK